MPNTGLGNCMCLFVTYNGMSDSCLIKFISLCSQVILTKKRKRKKLSGFGYDHDIWGVIAAVFSNITAPHARNFFILGKFVAKNLVAYTIPYCI